jgi:hypothetical protein
MILGNTYVYACPDCQLRVSKRSVRSGTKMGATYYSDLRIDAPGYPKIPQLTKCEQCECIFWLDETTKVEGAIVSEPLRFYIDLDHIQEVQDEKKNPAFGDQLEVHPAKELDREGIKDALFMNVQRDYEEEHYLRRLLLWAYHEQLQDGTLTRELLNEDLAYLQNIDALLRLLEEDADEEDGKLFHAELHRFAGRFERSLTMLTPYLNDPLWDPIVQKMRLRCEEGNREVFVLDVP